MKNNPILPRAEALAKEYGMFAPGSTVLLAVSGGRDSMTLLHWSAEHADTLQVKLAVGHYHHGMRGADADADEARVKDWCDGHGIPFYSDHGDVYGEADRSGLGVEETGRRLRYAFLEALADQLGASAIATAHNADDNAETLLLHLIRGSGLQGLTGIPPRRGRIVRPLLTTTRAEINAYAHAHAIPYGEDSTNADDSYSRNRLRHQVTPVLESINSRYVENASQTIQLLKRDNDYLNAQAAQLLMIARTCDGGILMEASFLANRPFPVSSRAVRQMLARLTGQTEFRLAHLQSVLDLAASDDPSGQVSLPYGVTAHRLYKDILLTTSPNPAPVETIPLSEGVTEAGEWLVTVQGSAPGLHLRSRRTGDEIRLPKQAKKSLKKLMIEKKIPRAHRNSLPVAADEQGVLAAALLGENTDHPLFGAVKITFSPKSQKERGIQDA